MSNTGHIIFYIGFAFWFYAGYKVGNTNIIKYIFSKSKCTNHLFEVDEVINLHIDPKCTKCGEKYSKIMQQKNLVEIIASEVENAKYANLNCTGTAERILKLIQSHDTNQIHK